MLFTKSIFALSGCDKSWRIYVPMPSAQNQEWSDRSHVTISPASYDECLPELMPNPASWRAYQESRLSWESFEEMYRYSLLCEGEAERALSLIISYAQFYPVTLLDCFPEMETEFSLRGVLAGVCKRWTKELEVVSG
jgi:uncharacterized protein YeaO (DUF488 family)